MITRLTNLDIKKSCLRLKKESQEEEGLEFVGHVLLVSLGQLWINRELGAEVVNCQARLAEVGGI